MTSLQIKVIFHSSDSIDFHYNIIGKMLFRFSFSFHFLVKSPHGVSPIHYYLLCYLFLMVA